MKKSKFERYLRPTVFSPKGHWMVGTIWPMQGSKDNVYNVELHDKGFNCDCPGFTFRGSCKHSQAVLKKVERAMA
jgi:hypothetical protein